MQQRNSSEGDEGTLSQISSWTQHKHAGSWANEGMGGRLRKLFLHKASAESSMKLVESHKSQQTCPQAQAPDSLNS